MQISQNLKLKQSQSLVMTPQLQQAIKLLQLTNLELTDLVEKELEENISSRSAKLRYVIKKSDFYKFETDIFKKFANLIDVENIAKKL